jgi:hypothetical protein
VRQIVLNLLSNSIKFTHAGGQVIVSTALNDNGEVALRVRDTGIGMSEQDLVTALEPFRQLATSVRELSAGTGLGLPLTRRWRRRTARASPLRARRRPERWWRSPFRRAGSWRDERQPCARRPGQPATVSEIGGGHALKLLPPVFRPMRKPLGIG